MFQEVDQTRRQMHEACVFLETRFDFPLAWTGRVSVGCHAGFPTSSFFLYSSVLRGIYPEPCGFPVCERTAPEHGLLMGDVRQGVLDRQGGFRSTV